MKKNKQKSDKLVWCEMGERIRIKKKKQYVGRDHKGFIKQKAFR